MEGGSEEGGHEGEGMGVCGLVNMGEQEGKERVDDGRQKREAILRKY